MFKGDPSAVQWSNMSWLTRRCRQCGVTWRRRGGVDLPQRSLLDFNNATNSAKACVACDYCSCCSCCCDRGRSGCGDLLREVPSRAGVIDRGYLGKGVVAGKVVRSEVDWRHASPLME